MTASERFMDDLIAALNKRGYDTEYIDSETLVAFADDWQFNITFTADLVS